MGFSLETNPFHQLRASPRDGRERLADLAEEAAEQGRLNVATHVCAAGWA